MPFDQFSARFDAAFGIPNSGESHENFPPEKSSVRDGLRDTFHLVAGRDDEPGSNVSRNYFGHGDGQ